MYLPRLIDDTKVCSHLQSSEWGYIEGWRTYACAMSDKD